MTARLPFCVCVPARNEEERLPRLLEALAQQDVAGLVPVAICLNNSTDRSAEAIAGIAERHRGRLAIGLDIVSFAPDLAHVGSARASAMIAGLEQLGDKAGVLIATDADARPPSDWITTNLDAIAAGGTIVGGRLVLDDNDPIPPELSAARALWDRYWTEVREIEDEIDPSPWDPPPRHGDHTGGSLAMTAEIYRRSGGVPLLASGEDRALVDAALSAGGRLVHPMSVWTRVSVRQDGRAANGMAEMMKRMGDTAANGGIELAPALSHWRQRALWRREMRQAVCDTGRLIEAERALPRMPHDAVLADMGLGS
ncbi:MAG: glycosyltransferase [Hyphomicrobiales bacterium]|nr:MAG: glycosyltransferase [Hyphomicrobiales bacterium]